MGLCQSIIAFVWGLLSATFFFIVPDVFLTGVAIRHVWRALGLCLLAVLGVGLGGLLLYMWAHAYPDAATRVISALPGTDLAMIESASTYLVDGNIFMPLFSILFGTPSKVYIVAAARLNLGWVNVVAVTLPAVAVRFFVMTGIFWAMSHYLWKGWRISLQQTAHALFWIIFYAAYFSARALGNL